MNFTAESQREARFQQWLEMKANYWAAIRENGDEPWFESDDQLREFWFQRYTRRPAAPSGLLPLRLAAIRDDPIH